MADAMMAFPELRHPFEETPIHPEGSTTILYQGKTVTLAETGDGDGLDSENGDIWDNEYGDVYDVMGDGMLDKAHFHMGAKNYLGWLTNAQVSNADSASDNGTFRIYAFDNASATGKQALKVSKDGTSEYYWLGYRSSLSLIHI